MTIFSSEKGGTCHRGSKITGGYFDPFWKTIIIVFVIIYFIFSYFI